MRIHGAVGLIIMVFSGVLAVHAQMTTGTISGTVTDASGAVLAGSKVTVQNEDTGVSRTVQADAAGHYSAPLLNPGPYQISASSEGFQTEVRKGIVLTVGREAVVNLQLSVGAVTQKVEVTAEAPLVNTTEATVSYLVNNTTLTELPLNGRDVSQLILLNPGINLAENGSNTSSQSGFAKRISIGGMRGEDNAYLLDGSYINDFEHHIPAGPSGSLLGVETVREFQVLTSTYGAQYGRALGGVFNAVSKSGTNGWHGDLYEFLRNSDMDARNFFDVVNAPAPSPIPPLRRNQFGATLGGPIRKDKTFFFINYEGTRQALTNTTTSIVPDANARAGILPGGVRVAVSPKIAPYLPYFPLPNGVNFGDGTAAYIFPAGSPLQENFGLARIDEQLSDKDSLFGRLVVSNSNQQIVSGFPAWGDFEFLNSRLLTIAETHIFSASLINKVQFSFDRTDPQDNGTYPPAVPALASVPGQTLPYLSPGGGITGIGGYLQGKDEAVGNRYTYQDDVNLNVRSHSLHLGGMFERLQFNTSLPDRPFGEWDFASVANFLGANPDLFRGTPPQVGNSDTGERQWLFALYLQDDWRVRPSLTLNLGLRWEPFTVPTEEYGRIANLRTISDPNTTLGNPYWLNNSFTNLGPRFGFAWSPSSSGKTSIRGGFGVFFVPLDSEVYQTRLARTEPIYPLNNFQITSAANAALFPNALAELAVLTATSLGAVEPLQYSGFKSSEALQYNFSIQQQLGANNVLTIGFQGTRGEHLFTYGNYNMPPLTFDGISLAVPANATVRNANFTCICLSTDDGVSRYDALVASFQHKFSAGFQAEVFYTWSKATDDSDNNQTTSGGTGGGGSGSLKDPFIVAASGGLSAYSMTNALRASYDYELPIGKGMTGIGKKLLSGWQLTGILTVQSGMPLWISAAVPTALAALQVVDRSPNLVPGSGSLINPGNPHHYLNFNSYSLPSANELGNLGRGTVNGPGLVNWDGGLIRNISLNERWHLQFRAEVFNMLNRADFADPADSIYSATGAPIGSAGNITTTVTPSREIQLALKLIF